MNITGPRALFLAAGVVALAACVSTPKERFAIEEIAGTTWINTEYKACCGRAEITTAGMMNFYSLTMPDEPPYRNQYTITENWCDKKGDLWFKSAWVDPDTGEKWYLLSKINKSGTVWEGCWRGSGYPTELSVLEGTLFIYYRQ
jgi:hypothetical protein